jgi:signal transduction histidine kinase
MDERFISNLDAIAAEAKRMTEMMSEMRQLALAKEYTKDRRAVDIGEAIKQVAGLYTRILNKQSTKLILQIADGLPPVYGNYDEVKQIVFNLLQNSDNHTENGTVTIRAELSQEHIKVTVSDTGTGISPELLPRVFERGIHGEDGGSGYGLAISRDIVTAYGGEIWIEGSSESGTDVIFTLLSYPHERENDNEQ